MECRLRRVAVEVLADWAGAARFAAVLHAVRAIFRIKERVAGGDIVAIFAKRIYGAGVLAWGSAE